MNKVILVGRIVKDPELKYTAGNGTALTKITIAVDKYNSKTKEMEADFIPLTIWGKQAESVATYLLKGSQLAISGRLQTGSYEKDGNKRYTTEVVVEEVKFVGGGKATSKKDDLGDMAPVDDDGAPWR